MRKNWKKTSSFVATIFPDFNKNFLFYDYCQYTVEQNSNTVNISTDEDSGDVFHSYTIFNVEWGGLLIPILKHLMLN